MSRFHPRGKAQLILAEASSVQADQAISPLEATLPTVKMNTVHGKATAVSPEGLTARMVYLDQLSKGISISPLLSQAKALELAHGQGLTVSPDMVERARHGSPPVSPMGWKERPTTMVEWARQRRDLDERQQAFI